MTFMILLCVIDIVIRDYRSGISLLGPESSS